MTRLSIRGGASVVIVGALVACTIAGTLFFGGSQSRARDPFASSVARPFTAAGIVETPIVFAAVGDFGTNNANEAAVANLIRDEFNPAFIVTAGDNSYGAAGMDINVGQYYHDYIGGYAGAFGQGSATNRFFPSAGNHEWDDGGGINAYLSFFDLPGAGIATSNTSGNERYYDFIHGPVHCFVISSDPREPGLITAHDPLLPTEVQAQWLKNALAASTAPWKLVLLHHPPYSSGTGHGSDTELQWPFEAWGASAVIAGHDHTYERILRDDDADGTIMPYFVNGLGGRERHGFPGSGFVPGSAARYAANFGAMRIEATSTRLDFEFHSVAGGGTLIDAYSLGDASPIEMSLEVNGSHPQSNLQPIAGPLALALDMVPGSAPETLAWRIGYLFGQQLRFLTPGGGSSSSPQVFATSAPLPLSNYAIISANLPDPSSVIVFLYGTGAGGIEAFEFVGATTSADAGPRVRLEINGEHPGTNIVSTPGPVAVTLDVDPQGANDSLNWYFARVVGAQLRFIGPGGATSVQPQIFESGPPVAATDRALPSTALSPGQSAVYFYYGMDGTEIEAVDTIVVRANGTGALAPSPR